jgi:hypothetical protein
MKRIMMKFVQMASQYVRCKYCGRYCAEVGAGTVIRGMCERCYENGGDDE